MNKLNTSPRISSFRAARFMPRSSMGGFTLIELAIVVAIASILVKVSLPPMASVFKSVRLTSASNAFLSHLHLARAEAIKRNSRVVLCKSRDGERCAEDGGWEQGWIVFHDADDNAVRDAGEDLIERASALARGIKLTGNATVARYVSFAATGGTKLVGGGFQAGTLTVCAESDVASEGRQIVINAAGRPRVHKASLASCP
ncbi:GspH/FimT family pseudopilin [Caenimonas aquaedulcis]|uniref:Type II secretion system protein H n=1 Tax=Caenimonas aquaedulcis TaxID=2793270 RepID=A0A931H2P8_9BURK|nr:GspH/FimT family pseudopilin [Caenimonas aquaedulcis]MBG9387504.1 GspH/FimT family pseudopilin [Caenimonas aquaedulcis]